ncbi:uncharacterized protein AMSG_12309 [Thecamonas trahens ATCC 50062]|uniref:WD repeat-containing protein on Y chromosome n=1 Tax=Thecamonas trahens ATCC 50062 TaxID=461836 RepID=A0A0L0DS03_THETB|nr:hypothetical protein AMSG_12309 [Thecamonas trahens ATCC 50062]KNC54213.1 hypothetical protein AMSG_12309 [Thecamonas trahens ATCC 50062]|eukprot:XP_013753913.1 hypothetical protein AMSG_12309 [Thecamonas trahens ATCC 50062]
MGGIVRTSSEGAAASGVGAKSESVDAADGLMQLLVTAGQDDLLIFWDVIDMHHHSQFKERTSEVTALAYDPSSDMLVTGHENGDMALWNIETGATIRVDAHSNTVTCLEVVNHSFSTSNTASKQFVISGSYDGTVARVMICLVDGVMAGEARDNKQAMASPSSRVAALGLYRTLLRTAQRWPAEPTRPDRSLAAMLPDAIRSRFRASAAAESDAKKLLAYGEAELVALRRMLHSTAKKQNPATVPYSIASEAERKKARLHSDVMLSSEAQNQSQTLVAKIKRVLGY